MKLVRKAARRLTYVSLIAVLIFFVMIRRDAVKRERSSEPVTYISEVAKYGKPVTIIKVKKAVFDMKEKFTVVPLSETKFEGFVTRKMVSNLEQGQLINALNGHSGITGEISYVSPEVDMMSGLYRVEIEFEKPIICDTGKLLVETKIGEKKDIIEVPNDALRTEQGKFYLWKVIDGKAHKQEVEVTARSGYSSIIDSGLKEKDILVITGQSRLEEGDLVRIVNNKNRDRQE